MDSNEEMKKKLGEVIHEALGHSEPDGTYVYNLTRVKEAFSVGTMTMDDFVEVDDQFTDDLVESVFPMLHQLLEENEQLEKLRVLRIVRNAESEKQLNTAIEALEEFVKNNFHGGSKANREDYNTMVSTADIYKLREALLKLKG